MKKIRVLHILDELNTGGAERIVFSYYCNINRDLFQWDFVMTRYEDPQMRGILEDSIEAMGGRIYRVHRKRENYLKNITDIGTVIKEGNYDIVHSHLDELSTFYLMSAKRYGVPVRICHSHLAGTDRGRGVEMLCKALRPLMHKVTTNKFACGNDAGVALWGEKAVRSKDVHIMKNAIDTRAFSYDETVGKQKRNSLGVSSDKLVLGTVGRLSYQKNSDYVIDIFNEYHKNNPNSVLLIVGVGDLMNDMKKKVEDYNLQRFVEFLGSRNDVNELMMAMDVFLLPSRFEGLPIVLVEAQCAGLPCVVSDRVTQEVRLRENVKYLSLEAGLDEWAQAVDGVVGALPREMGKNCIIDNGYDIEHAAKDLSDYYLSLLGDRCEENI